MTEKKTFFYESAGRSQLLDLAQHPEAELDEAERKAWDSLGRYKFQMFGYWAGIWVHLNRTGAFHRSNPWQFIVKIAKQTTDAIEQQTPKGDRK